MNRVAHCISCTWLCIGLASGVTAQEVSIDDLIRLAEDTSKKVEGIDFSFVSRQTQTAGKSDHELLARAPMTGQLEGRIRVQCGTAKYLYTYRAGDNQPQLTSAFDGQAETLYNAQSKQGAVTEKDGPGMVIETANPVLMALMTYPPKPDGFGVDDMSLVSFLRRGELRDETAPIDGHPCHLVDSKTLAINGKQGIYATLWIDAACGGLVRQMHLFDSKGNITTKMHIKKAKEFKRPEATSVWVPTLIDREVHTNGLGIRQTTEVDSENLALNPEFTEESFRAEFPPGTVVIDTATETSFRIPGGESEIERAEIGTRSSKSLTFLIGSTITLVGLLAWLLWMSRTEATVSEAAVSGET